MGSVLGVRRDRARMTDPITCPECQGSKGELVGPLFLACRFCGGLGWVGGDNEPAEACSKPPPPEPTATNHRVWSDPVVSAAFPCRLCFGSRKVAHFDREAGTLVQVPCRCAGGEA
ncbi:hypothetical protein FH608_046205 [Nonomuraea phyllanthi]|uniref:Uncharacterized protein n=1 Tax=Nonomuraea phyllanthi TaxID=2219224 RepID=A0A5C4V8S1_9ACTN|nr:hypothetical protein [Nonomuraea phyllanthi]KAB8186888.1 hypothetical protein FH608_046205 [Nonomuraea phyllanthi]